MSNGRKSNGKATGTWGGTNPDNIDFTKIKPLGDNIVFYWVDDVEDSYELSSGIVIARTLSKNRDRWGKIVAVGPKSAAEVGQYVLPDKVCEPFGAMWEGLEIWRTRDDMVVCVSDDYEVTKTMNE